MPLRKYIREIIKEEIGRNYHTINSDPHTFESFQDYEILINPVSPERYSVVVNYKSGPIANQATFKRYEDAKHHARMIIDKHRVSVMNSSI